MAPPTGPTGPEKSNAPPASHELHHASPLRPENPEPSGAAAAKCGSHEKQPGPETHPRAPVSRLSSQDSVDKAARPERPPSRNHKSVPGAAKRPPAKRNLHARSQSHNKVPTRLSTSATAAKPNLSRSKSTDGIVRTLRPGVKRNNRSYTKLSSLQPLTKTLSNSSMTRPLQPLTRNLSRESLKLDALRKTTSNNSVHLQKSDSNPSIKSCKSNSSLKGLGGAHTGLKTSAKRGRAILSLNEDPGGDFEDTSDSDDNERRFVEPQELTIKAAPDGRDASPHRAPSEHTISESRAVSENIGRFTEEVDSEPHEHQPGDYHAAQSLSQAANQNSLQHLSRSLSQAVNENSVQELSRTLDQKLANLPNLADPHRNSAQSDFDDVANLYGGSFLLSQSTGMTRKIEPSNESSSYVSTDDRENVGSDKSGIVFKPRAKEGQDPEPAAAKTAVSQGSYQPHQTIFSNLQRNDSQYLSTIKSQRQQPNAPKNFSGYLSGSQNGSNNIETRTQQRLWLQRENSFFQRENTYMDADPKSANFSNLSLNKLMFAHNYNNSTTNMRDVAGSQGKDGPEIDSLMASSSVGNIMYLVQGGQQSIESRTEFERLNREYVNVRRHVNPVASSLGRVQRASGKTAAPKAAPKSSFNGNANSFQEFAGARDEEAHGVVNRLWHEALVQSSAVSAKLHDDGRRQATTPTRAELRGR